jgi:molecular chaperone GrpE
MQTLALANKQNNVRLRCFCEGKKNSDSNEQPQDQVENNEEKPKSLGEINVNLELQIKEMRDKVLRAYADEENVRRIAKRDVENARVYANTKFAKSLLDVADNLERALAAATSETGSDKKAFEVLVEGVAMTHTQLKKVFESHGVVKVLTFTCLLLLISCVQYGEVGDQFDPTIHDALFNMPDPTKTSGTVGQVLKAGYKLHDRVIRPAEVGTITNPE